MHTELYKIARLPILPASLSQVLGALPCNLTFAQQPTSHDLSRIDRGLGAKT
jgi:hypothetical protein